MFCCCDGILALFKNGTKPLKEAPLKDESESDDESDGQRDVESDKLSSDSPPVRGDVTPETCLPNRSPTPSFASEAEMSPEPLSLPLTGLADRRF